MYARVLDKLGVIWVLGSNWEEALAFQRVPDSVEIIINGSMAGQEIINTFYGQMASYSLADIETLAAAVDTWAGALWRTIMPNNYTYVGTTVRGLNAAIDIEASNNDSAGTGSFGSECPANNIALSVKRASGHTGRGARGRVYIPVPESAINADNTVTTAFGDAAVTILDALDAAITAQGFLPIIVHRVEAGVSLPVAVVFTLVEWVVVDYVLDSMRRRLPRRGV